MKQWFNQLFTHINTTWVLENIEALWKRELGQCFRHYREAALFVENLLRESGLACVERIPFPADGKTAYQDKTSPLAWDATCGKLTVLRSPNGMDGMVVADYERHPFHLIKGSVSTPPEGITTRLLTEYQLYSGADPRHAMVITNPETRPRHEMVRSVLDLGALGFISDHITGRYQTPDAIPWINACTEEEHWHVVDGDRPFIGFAVSPRVGDQLRAAAWGGETIVHVVCDGKRYAGEIDVVTALLPGRDAREVWLMAHLYEPLANDNAAGVIAAIEIARSIKRMRDAGEIPQPRFTLRLVFGLEMYGYAAFAEHMGGYLRDKVLGALNLDALPVTKPGQKVGPISSGSPGLSAATAPIQSQDQCIWLAPAGSPFFGDYLLEELHDTCERSAGLSLEIREEGMYCDDLFLNDPTTGLATIWILGSTEIWHSSIQDMSIIAPDALADAVAYHGAWTAAMLTLNERNMDSTIDRAAFYARRHLQAEVERIFDEYMSADEHRRCAILENAPRWMALRCQREQNRLADFRRVCNTERVNRELSVLCEEVERQKDDLLRRLKDLPHSKDGTAPRDVRWVQIAAEIIPRRATRGQPYDLCAVPRPDRRSLPDVSIYGPFGNIQANMDGHKSLKELLFVAEWETHSRFSPAQVKGYIGAVEYLTDHGYLHTTYTHTISKSQIISALRQAGIEEGDLIVLHSGLSYFGHIDGGAETVIDAFLETLAASGTLLMPTFTNSCTYSDGNIYPSRQFRPYHPDKSHIWVGRIPRVFVRREGVFRSKHPSHSVAGIGPLAHQCLAEHRETDPPMSRNSPWGKLLDYNGKIVFFGAGLACTTFFHFLEYGMDLPYLGDALCYVEDEEGKVRPVLIHKHVPGHRDFYREPAEETKMYRRLLQDGLVIKKAKLRYGEIKVIYAKQMYELGIRALQDDPWLMLCDDSACQFCSRYMHAGTVR